MGTDCFKTRLPMLGCKPMTQIDIDKFLDELLCSKLSDLARLDREDPTGKTGVLIDAYSKGDCLSPRGKTLEERHKMYDELRAKSKA